MSDNLNGVTARIGWYQLEEDFQSDGTIEVAVYDPRSGELVVLELDTIEEHTKLLELLDNNRQVGTLSRVS